jgi:hypothetical protein
MGSVHKLIENIKKRDSNEPEKKKHESFDFEERLRGHCERKTTMGDKKYKKIHVKVLHTVWHARLT